MASRGFGAKQHLRNDRLLTLSEDLPLVSVAVDTRARIEQALADVTALRFNGLAAVQRVVRLDQRARGLRDRAQVVRAMLAERIRVVFVTHMYDLAHGFHAQQLHDALFLRAEREEPAGRRTFSSSRASRCPPATARTRTGGSSMP